MEAPVPLNVTEDPLQTFAEGVAVAPIVGIGGGTTALPTALVIAVAEVLALIIFLTITRKYVKTIASNTKG